jgi:chaperone BCS1
VTQHMIGSWHSWLVHSAFQRLVLRTHYLIRHFDQSKQQVWRQSWNFKISAKTLQRKNGVEASEISKGHNSENAEYVPTYQRPQVFRWNGYWVEVSKSISLPSYDYQTERTVSTSTIYLT